MNRQVNQAGADLVKSFEGLKLDAYRCPAGVWTIGYGHTGSDVKPDLKISEQEAEHLLQEDLNQSGVGVEKLVKVTLTDNQFAALVSFAFNAGLASLAASTLLKRLNDGDYHCVPAELSKWVKATDPRSKEKITLPGLVKRRAAEGVLWLTDNGSTSALTASDDMVQSVESDDSHARFQVIARGGLKVRAGAGLEFAVTQMLAEHTIVHVIKEKNDWAAIDLEGDGLIDGWVSLDFLRHTN